MRTATILSHDKEHIEYLQEILNQANLYRNRVAILPTIQVGQLEVRTRPTNDNIAEEFIIETAETIHKKFERRILDCTGIVQTAWDKANMGQPLDTDTGNSNDTGKVFPFKKVRNIANGKTGRARNGRNDNTDEKDKE